ncbi:transcriptional regulator FtrA [Ideonella azotifigens]|uniref:Transcriptional regulator FtrA n=1 Tax=Ideonella azotifigens TaxID=513160 RepID=A0ABP3VNI9_9BURK|nr:transcriptional regulator FtrA [Ideonella azotifigens]MCD2340593.1 transcriptional regulator FtrA [Ideonella azotifigens]
MQDHLVAALAYDQLCTFEFGCTVELFALQRPELGVPWYDFKVCAAEPGPLRAAGGIQVLAPHGLRTLARADTIVVPGWRGADQAPPEPLLRALRRAHARGARLCSICSGVFVLAGAGLLDGLTVSTHWRYAEKLAARYPALKVDANALYVDQGQILTSAGSAAGLDMLLHLVRRDHGVRVANQVAQRLVLPPHRDGGQAQFVPRPLPSDEGSRVARLMDWLRANPRLPHTLASMAAEASMSPRSLQRQFQAASGLGPVDWLIRERVGLAKELLETHPERALAEVAELAGFGAEESMRRHFRRLAQVSPAAYRRQFANLP